MDPKIKLAWIEALTSGKYNQSIHKLKNMHDSYCCLGVLCDLHSKITGSGSWKSNPTDTNSYVYSCDLDPDAGGLAGSDYLPKLVYLWAGLSDDKGTYHDVSNRRSQSLTQLNDENGLSFKQIAEVIKENF